MDGGGMLDKHEDRVTHNDFDQKKALKEVLVMKDG
jgi:hypothetical protein